MLTPNLVKIELNVLKINLPDITINNYLYKIRIENYPNDEELMKLISNLRIEYELGDNIINEKLCFGNKIVFNSEKDKIESYVIFTNLTQLKLLQM